MLKFYLMKTKNYSAFSIGIMMDFFIKKKIEILMKHIFIYLGLLFAEKFLIEFITKKNLEIIFLLLNKHQSLFLFSFSNFFLFTIAFIFFSLSSINILFAIFL